MTKDIGWSYEWQWTNWTFGFWWGPIGRFRCIGVELGPLQIQHRSWRNG